MQPVYRPTGTIVRMTKDDIVVEKDVPIPIAHGRPRKGPHLAVQRAMETMDIGDSFVSPIDSKATLAVAKGVRIQTGRKFSTRSDFGTTPPTVRVWRTK